MPQPPPPHLRYLRSFPPPLLAPSLRLFHLGRRRFGLGGVGPLHKRRFVETWELEAHTTTFDPHPDARLNGTLFVPLVRTGEEGQDFITVEACGDDFLGALADAVQPTDEWDDLNGIETEACGNLNDMIMKGVPQCERPAAAAANDPSTNRTPDDLEDLTFSSDDDSDFQMDDRRNTSSQRNASRSSETRTRSSAKSTVRRLFRVTLLPVSFSCKSYFSSGGNEQASHTNVAHFSFSAAIFLVNSVFSPF
jgi:hypothetical protein